MRAKESVSERECLSRRNERSELGKGVIRMQENWKLSHKQKLRICELLAQFYPVKQVGEMIEREYGIKVSLTNIKNNYQKSKKWIPKIEYFRKQYLESYMDEPCANKRVRIQKLQRIYEESMKWRKVGETKSGEPILKQNLLTANQAMRELRAECQESGPTSSTSLQLSGKHNNYYIFQDLTEKNKGKSVDDRIRNLNTILSTQNRRES